MPILPQELLTLVLNKLERADELARCAVVSKRWAAAAARCQPQTLRFSHTTNANQEIKIACCKLRSLQTWHRQGRLQNLKQLHFDVFPAVNISADASLLCQGLILLAGAWDLALCRLHGPVCLEAAAGLLPATLLGLDLWPDSGPRFIRLSAFERFEKLQMLNLAVGTGDDDEAGPTSCQLLLDTAFSCVKHVVIHDRLLCGLAQGITMETCFPNVLTLGIKVKSDERGRSLVQGALALQKLEVFKLDVLQERGLPWDLIVPKSSSIQHLVVVVTPPAPLMTVHLQKPDIQYSCSGVGTVCSECVLAPAPYPVLQ